MVSLEGFLQKWTAIVDKEAFTKTRHVMLAGLELQPTQSAGAQRPTPGGGAGSLTIVDNRTGKKYEIKVGT